MNCVADLTRRDLLFGQFTLIYQMPKIGSQTIEASLRQYAFPNPVLRFHYLSSTFAATLRHGLSSGQPDAAWRRTARLQLDSISKTASAMRWRRILCRCGMNIPKLKIITGVRELIGLVLASIFENYAYFAPDIESMTIARCREALVHPKTFKALRDWFDLEIRAFTGIDVFQTPFPFERGYAIYENRFARILVYRYKSLNQLPDLLSSFLNWKIPALVSCNVGDSKSYANQYRLVKNQLNLPSELVQAVCDCKLMRHFYSDHEREHFYARWADHRPRHSYALPQHLAEFAA